MSKKIDPMTISSTEAREALAAIDSIAQRTRHSVASGGTTVTLVVTGIVWLLGFTSQQFLPKEIVGAVWIVLSTVGTGLGLFLGFRMGKRLRSPSTGPMAKRAGLFWLFLVLFAVTIIAIVRPADGKQATLLIVLFIMLGQLAMGLLFSFSTVWWALPVSALAVAGYFLLPGIFYLWMAVLGGGGMIALGLYIRRRW